MPKSRRRYISSVTATLLQSLPHFYNNWITTEIVVCICVFLLFIIHIHNSPMSLFSKYNLCSALHWGKPLSSSPPSGSTPSWNSSKTAFSGEERSWNWLNTVWVAWRLFFVLKYERENSLNQILTIHHTTVMNIPITDRDAVPRVRLSGHMLDIRPTISCRYR